jgi:hypothetical protein
MPGTTLAKNKTSCNLQISESHSVYKEGKHSIRCSEAILEMEGRGWCWAEPLVGEAVTCKAGRTDFSDMGQRDTCKHPGRMVAEPSTYIKNLLRPGPHLRGSNHCSEVKLDRQLKKTRNCSLGLFCWAVHCFEVSLDVSMSASPTFCSFYTHGLSRRVLHMETLGWWNGPWWPPRFCYVWNSELNSWLIPKWSTPSSGVDAQGRVKKAQRTEMTEAVLFLSPLSRRKWRQFNCSWCSHKEERKNVDFCHRIWDEIRSQIQAHMHVNDLAWSEFCFMLR